MINPNVGIMSRAKVGERECGDTAVILCPPGIVLFAVADGLGHGVEAQKASRLACAVVEENPERDPAALIDLCHAALRSTRGAALSITKLVLDDAGANFENVAVGNVETTCFGTHSVRTISTPGIVGCSMRKLFVNKARLGLGDLIVAFSDGISSSMDPSQLSYQTAQELSAGILERWGKGHDDATCVAILL